MARTKESPQVVWQEKFQQEYELNPFQSQGREQLRYNRLDDAKTWWFNPLNPDSLRLSRIAYNMLKKAKVPTFKFKLTEKYKSKTFVQLERWMSSPYYLLNAQTIVLYSDSDAMMMALHGNNLQQYLDNQEK